jgi:uncharacterized membrane protein YhaH (DUF805 family)
MRFQDAIRVCFSKYATFSGRASRPEYWWFVLFLCLGTLLPSLAAATRRLHDTQRSGWWQLVGLVPLVGLFVLIYFLAQESKEAASV